MNPNQQGIKEAIEYWSNLLGLDPVWTSAVAMVESSLGEHRVSNTGCLGIFQMSTVAMADLRQDDDDTTQILCGLLFLRLLLQRWGTEDEAINHFCDPADRSFYLDRVHGYMESFAQAQDPPPPADPDPAPEKRRNWWESIWG